MQSRKNLYTKIALALNIQFNDISSSEIDSLAPKTFLLNLLNLIFDRPISSKFETDCYKCLKLINEFPWSDSPEIQDVLKTIDTVVLTLSPLALRELIKSCRLHSEKIEYLTRVIEIRNSLASRNILEFIDLYRNHFKNHCPRYIAEELIDACLRFNPSLTASLTAEEAGAFNDEISLTEKNFKKALSEFLLVVSENLPHPTKKIYLLCRDSIYQAAEYEHVSKEDKLINEMIKSQGQLLLAKYNSLSPSSINFDDIMVFLRRRFLQQAAAKNNIQLFMALKNEGVNYYADNHFALKIAVIRGHQKMASALLSLYNKNAMPLPEEIIFFAAEFGRLEILKLLDRWEGKMNAQDDLPFILACQNGHMEVAQFLHEHTTLDDSGIAQPTVDVCAQDNLALCAASLGGHIDIVKFLLKNSKINPCSPNNFPLLAASVDGHENIVEFLRSDTRIQIDATILQLAFEKNFIHILAVLLSIPGANDLSVRDKDGEFSAYKIVENTFFPTYRKFQLFKTRFEDKKQEPDLNADVLHHMETLLFQNINFPLSFLFHKQPPSESLKPTAEVKNRM